MEEISAQELRQVQLDMLNDLDALCRKEKIEYTLIGGSLLGAVRHQGFIPWDDDIDIALRRVDYEKLLNILPDFSEKYGLCHYSIGKVYQPFAKIFDQRTIVKSHLDRMYQNIGVFIDIFPYDNLPSTEEERVKFIKSVEGMAENLASTDFPAYASGSKWYYALARLFLRFPRFLKFHGKNHEVAQELDNYMQKYNGSLTKERGYIASRYWQKEHFPSEIFDSYEDTAFENLTVRKIKNHDAYLTQLFGNYMQLPPENQRTNHSYYTFYWK